MLPNSAPGLAVADQVKHQKSRTTILKYTRDTLVMPNTLTHDTDHSMVVSDILMTQTTSWW